jgi:uncharacterized cupredoxin-like copper-binding protein
MKTFRMSLVLIALLLAACGGGESTPAPAPTEPAAGSAQAELAATLDILMKDIYFGDNSDNLGNPPVWTVAAGSEVSLNLVNKGGLEHNWAVVKPGSELPKVITAGNLLGGKSLTEPFTAPAAGEYLVICTVAGHYPAMQGKLIVQ